MKKIAILGSTGSIGTQTLDIVREQGDIQVVAMAAGSNISLLEAQMREVRPSLVSVWDEKKASELRTNTKDLGIKIVSGMEGLLEVSVIPESEILVTAIVGMLGIRPTIAAIKAGKKIALANKETLVTAGHIIIPLAKEYKVPILPVDSEHSAIFQSLQGAGDNKISRILLTASGGPFRGRKADELKNIQVEDALKHPNWSMGRKITIDSSTLVNKGLEVMEAKWLFDVALDQIQVVVHPQSVIHSAVETKRLSTRKLVLIALMTAITCIFAPMAIPIPVSPVPISLTNLVIMISIYVLGFKDATISYIVYLLLGLVGLPVFSGFTGGLGKLAGPTGGYLIGFIFLALIAGLFVDKFPKNRILAVVGMLIGMAITYIFGTEWLAIQLKMSFVAALSVGVIPYLAGDAVKIIIAIIVGPVLRSRLSHMQ